MGTTFKKEGYPNKVKNLSFMGNLRGKKEKKSLVLSLTENSSKYRGQPHSYSQCLGMRQIYVQNHLQRRDAFSIILSCLLIFIGMDARVGQYIALDLGLVVVELVNPPVFLHPHHQDQLSISDPPSLSKIADNKGQDHFYWSHGLGGSSPALTHASVWSVNNVLTAHSRDSTLSGVLQQIQGRTKTLQPSEIYGQIDRLPQELRIKRKGISPLATPLPQHSGPAHLCFPYQQNIFFSFSFIFLVLEIKIQLQMGFCCL